VCRGPRARPGYAEVAVAKWACRLYLRQVIHRPLADRDERVGERLPERGEPVFDARRDDVDHGPLDEAVRLHAAQGLGEHLLRDALDHPLQLAVSSWTVEQRVDDQAHPFVGDPIQGLARFAVLAEDVGAELVDSVHSLLIHRFHATGGGTPVNAYIVESDSGAVVIDATLTVSDGRRLRARVAELGKPLLGVVVTHAHPDHYGGLVELTRDRSVPVFATAGVAGVIRRDDPFKETILRPMFGDEWSAVRAFPNETVSDGDVVALDGIRLRVTDLGPGESPHDSIWTLDQDRRQVFSADLAYDRHHCYLADGFHQQWLANIGRAQEELPGGRDTPSRARRALRDRGTRLAGAIHHDLPRRGQHRGLVRRRRRPRGDRRADVPLPSECRFAVPHGAVDRPGRRPVRCGLNRLPNGVRAIAEDGLRVRLQRWRSGSFSYRKGEAMTGKADFTPEEWDLLLEAPPTAGMIVITAQRGGTFRETLALAKTYAEARQQHGESELLDEIVAAKPEIDHKRHHSYEELREHGLKQLQDASHLLDEKATPDEAEGYKRFVVTLVEKVAHAHREHGAEVSDAEQTAINEITAALGDGGGDGGGAGEGEAEGSSTA
jgi:glyoxylase-like metal-dependent hydrolase (beta-lactamase superfamily II)